MVSGRINREIITNTKIQWNSQQDNLWRWMGRHVHRTDGPLPWLHKLLLRPTNVEVACMIHLFLATLPNPCNCWWAEDMVVHDVYLLWGRPQLLLHGSTHFCGACYNPRDLRKWHIYNNIRHFIFLALILIQCLSALPILGIDRFYPYTFLIIDNSIHMFTPRSDQVSFTPI